MFKKIKYYIFIIIISAHPRVLGYAEIQQNLRIYNPTIINIQAINPEKAKGKISPENGNLSNISAAFNILANGFLVNYDFILTAKANTLSGETNAYYYDGSNMYIILSNSSNLPNIQSLNDIKTGTPKQNNNANAIAYPVSNSSQRLYTITVKNDSKYDGIYYNLYTFWYKADFIQSLGSTPMLNTYSINNDNAGIYQATLTLTALPTP